MVEDISKNIKEARIRKGISLEKLAQKSGVACKSVWNLENGRMTSLTTLIAVCNALSLKIVIKEN